MSKNNIIETRTGKTKNPYANEQWTKKKREGRPKQQWVIVENATGGKVGYWEKINDERS